MLSYAAVVSTASDSAARLNLPDARWRVEPGTQDRVPTTGDRTGGNAEDAATAAASSLPASGSSRLDSQP
jgi:hypothetical protein